MGYRAAGFELHFASISDRPSGNLAAKAGCAYDILSHAPRLLWRAFVMQLLIFGRRRPRPQYQLSFEAGIGFAVKFGKENFIGKAACSESSARGNLPDGVARHSSSGDVGAETV